MPTQLGFNQRARAHVAHHKVIFQSHLNRGFRSDRRTRDMLLHTQDPIKVIQYIDRLLLPREDNAVQNGFTQMFLLFGLETVLRDSFEAQAIANPEFYSQAALEEAVKRIARLYR